MRFITAKDKIRKEKYKLSTKTEWHREREKQRYVANNMGIMKPFINL